MAGCSLLESSHLLFYHFLFFNSVKSSNGTCSAPLLLLTVIRKPIVSDTLALVQFPDRSCGRRARRRRSWGMEQPIFVRRISPKQRKKLETGLRSPEAYVMRRSQIILASARGARASEIARQFGCSEGTARNTINSFNRHGLECLQKKSSRPKKLRTLLDEKKRENLRALLHTSPRTWGKERSLWTLELAAEVCFAQGVTPQQVSIETIRQALVRLGVSWKRAKHWITSPDPQYALKKTARPFDPAL